jgi:hypothetical protein
MLPSDVTARKVTARAQNAIELPSAERTMADYVTAYSNKASTQTAIEWIICTNQVCICDVGDTVCTG